MGHLEQQRCAADRPVTHHEAALQRSGATRGGWGPHSTVTRPWQCHAQASAVTDSASTVPTLFSLDVAELSFFLISAILSTPSPHAFGEQYSPVEYCCPVCVFIYLACTWHCVFIYWSNSWHDHISVIITSFQDLGRSCFSVTMDDRWSEILLCCLRYTSNLILASCTVLASLILYIFLPCLS